MKIIGIEILRGLAAIGIVGCHLALEPFTKGGAWLLHYTDVAVGIFGAISGYLLAKSVFGCGEAISVKRVIGKKVSRILPAYAFWTAVYLLASPILDFLVRGGALNVKFYQKGFWFSAVFNGGAACHLWYLIHLLYASIILIFLWRFARRIFGNSCVLLAVSWIALAASMCLSGNLFFYGIRLFSFVTLGSVIYLQREFLTRIPSHVWIIILFLTAVLHFVIPLRPAFLKDYLLVFPIMMIALNWNHDCGDVITRFCSHSFGIYLVHPLIAVGMSVLIKRCVSAPYPMWIIAGDWFIIVVLSVVTVFLLKKLPVASRFLD